jgi:phosphoesterase RecJ-like protein
VTQAGALDAAYARAVAAVRDGGGLVVTTHENPDGDALGSLVAAARTLRLAGRDVVPFLVAGSAMPQEYGWLDDLRDVQRELPADWRERTLLALDCGSAARTGLSDEQLASFRGVVNVDHHHDNPGYGTAAVVDPAAPCCTVMVRRLLDELGAPLDDVARQAVYVGLVTDTGRFSYSNTSAAALREAARLVEEGVRPHEIFGRVFEDVPVAKARLLGIALSRLELRLDGRLALTWLLREDFAAAGAEEPFSEGIIEHVRALRGVEVAALLREPRDASGPRFKASLRSKTPEIDVSRVARLGGGGGHVQAAGFSGDLELDELKDFLERELGAGVAG